MSSSVCPLDHVLTSKHRRPESMTHLKHRVRQRSLDHLCPPSSTYSLSLLSSLFAVPPSWEAKSFLNKTFLFGCVHASSVPAERLSRCAFPRQAQVKRPDSINLRVKGSDVFGASSENGHDTRSLLATDLKTWRQPPLLTCGGLRDDSVDLLTAGLRYSGLPPCSARSRRTTFQPGRGNRRRSRHSDLSRNLTEPNRWQLSLERVAVAVGVVSSSQQSVPAVVFARRRGGSLIREKTRRLPSCHAGHKKFTSAKSAITPARRKKHNSRCCVGTRMRGRHWGLSLLSPAGNGLRSTLLHRPRAPRCVRVARR